jgi:hypothetical protein
MDKMNLQENIHRIKQVMGINEIIMDLSSNDATQSTYNEEFTIIDKKADGETYEYIVGGESPVGRFVMPPVDKGALVPELYLVNPSGGKEDARNFFRCIGSLGSVLKDYVGDGNLPDYIIFNPSDDAHEKRYKSPDFVTFIRGYIGNDYMYMGSHGINALWMSKAKGRKF